MTLLWDCLKVGTKNYGKIKVDRLMLVDGHGRANGQSSSLVMARVHRLRTNGQRMDRIEHRAGGQDASSTWTCAISTRR